MGAAVGDVEREDPVLDHRLFEGAGVITSVDSEKYVAGHPSGYLRRSKWTIPCNAHKTVRQVFLCVAQIRNRYGPIASIN
jgi:hypothetical protein